MTDEMYKLARPMLQGVQCSIINNVAVGIKNKMVRDMLSGIPQFKGEIVVGNPVTPDCFERTSDFLEDPNRFEPFVFWVYDMRTTDLLDLRRRLEIVGWMAPTCGPFVQVVEHELLTKPEELSAYIKKVVTDNFFPGIVLREPYGTFGTFDEAIPKESLAVVN